MVHSEAEATAEDIAEMRVRGAATIADAAAGAIETQAREADTDSPDELRKLVLEAARVLSNTRPTTVSLQ